MPPRYTYWTIIAGDLPTAFRAADRDELLPTFQRIRQKHPDAQMKWFARGKLWDSPEAARVRRDENRGGDRRGRPLDRDHPHQPSDHGRRGGSSGPPETEKRGHDWRPGGEHRDPRQKFVDAKKQRNAALRKERWERKNVPPRERRHGDPLRDEIRESSEGFRGQGSGGRAVPGNRPQGGRNQWRDRSRPSPKPGAWSRKPGFRGQGTEERQEPQRPRGPDSDPKPHETPAPTPPHTRHRRPFQPRGNYPKGPRR